MRTRTQLLLTALSAVVILAGCSAANDSNVNNGSNSDTSQIQSFNDDDVMFAQMMIPHHEQAIEMADIALDPTTEAGNPIKDLATRIKDSQDPEIEIMTDLLTQWGQPTTADADVDHSSMMEGMLTIEELDSMSGLRGDEFDRTWIEAMIAHHEGAVSMAEDVLERGVSPQLRALAEDIISTQQQEVAEMRALL